MVKVLSYFSVSNEIIRLLLIVRRECFAERVE